MVWELMLKLEPALELFDVGEGREPHETGHRGVRNTWKVLLDAMRLESFTLFHGSTLCHDSAKQMRVNVSTHPFSEDDVVVCAKVENLTKQAIESSEMPGKSCSML